MDSLMPLLFVALVFVCGVVAAALVRRWIVGRRERHYPLPETLRYAHDLSVRARQLNQDARELQQRAARLNDLLTSKRDARRNASEERE